MPFMKHRVVAYAQTVSKIQISSVRLCFSGH